MNEGLQTSESRIVAKVRLCAAMLSPKVVEPVQMKWGSPAWRKVN